jgi:thiol-disulfide isomerase/thioredoxin
MQMASCVGLAFILALAVVGCDRGPGAGQKAASPAHSVGPPAKPQAALPRLDLDGLRTLIAQSADKKEVLVIDFWATWCAPCVDLFPALHEGVDKLGKGVRLTSVTLDTPGELEGAALKFLDKHHATQDAYLLDPDADKRLAVVDGLGKRWNNLVVPAILVYGRDGQLAYEFFERDKVDEMLAKIAQLTTAQTVAGPVQDAATQPAASAP